MSLLIYIDTETTGRFPSSCGITQMSAIIVRDGVEISTFDIDINPYSYNRDISVSAKAFEVTNKTIAEVKKYPSASIGYFKFVSWLNAHREPGEYYKLIAYRTAYDLEVLEELFQDQTGDRRKLFEYVHFKTLDVLELIKFGSLWGLHKLKNEKLSTACEHYGIELEAHNSLNDIRATRKLHKKLMASLGLGHNTIKKV